jgi:hypothetical protein
MRVAVLFPAGSRMMAQFITDHAFAFIALGRTCIAGAIVAIVLAAVWTFQDLDAEFRASLDDEGDEFADGAADLHDDGCNAA